MEPNKVRQIIEEWAAGARARDIDRVMSHHASDLLMFEGGTGQFELVDLKVTGGADVALATALLKCAGTEVGKKVAFTLRLTVGLEKRDGGWMIVHEHHSEPLDFDTARIGA